MSIKCISIPSIIAVASFLYVLYLSTCDELDTCLDRGGGWDHDANQCIFGPAVDAGHSDGGLEDDV